jgi:hypothetical protein
MLESMNPMEKKTQIVLNKLNEDLFFTSTNRKINADLLFNLNDSRNLIN